MNVQKTAINMAVGLLAILALGCVGYQVVPDSLEPKLNRDVRFKQVFDAPESHRGKMVAWGGEVLSARRVDGGTRMEVLQLPLTDDLHPTSERARSRGRFVAFDGEGTIVDPVVVDSGTPVTIIGTIESSEVRELHGAEYRYPRVNVLDMTVWDRDVIRRPYGPGLMWGAFPYYAYGFRPRSIYEGHRVD